MDGYLLKGIIIGLLFGMPFGAVGAMTVHRTMNHGIKAGLVTGLGSSIADCIYAGVGVFGLTAISELLIEYSSIINTLGGSLILIMGISMILKRNKDMQKVVSFAGNTRCFLSSFAVGMTNPAAILTFLFAFSWFGIKGQVGIGTGIQLVCGVFIGTYLWWGLLSVGIGMWKNRIKENSLRNMNRLFGIILIVFGLVVLIRAFCT